MLVQNGSINKNTVYISVHGKNLCSRFCPTQAETSGASWLVCCCSNQFRQKIFIFCASHPWQAQKILVCLALPTGQGRNLNLSTRRKSIVPKFFWACQGQAENKIFLDETRRQGSEKACCISCRKIRKKRANFRFSSKLKKQEKPHHNRLSCYSAVLLPGSGKGIRTLGLQCHKLTR